MQGEELLQLQERGIALQDELQKMYGLTGEEFSKALQKGQFSAEAVEVAIKRLTEAGGKYADGAISQSDTLAGKFSTLIDGIENIARTLGNVLSPALKTILDQAIGVVNSINAALAAGRRMQQFGIDAGRRNELFQQAGREAEELTRLRNGGNINAAEFTRLRDERFKDLIEGFGYETGQIEVEIKPVIAENNIPELLKQNTKKDGGGSASSVTSELEKQRQKLEEQFEAGEEIKRQQENRMMLLSAATDLERERVQIAIDLDDQIRRIQQTAAPSQQEGLIISATEEARLKDVMAMVESFAQDVGTWDFLPKANQELTETEELLKSSYEIVANGLQSGIKGLIDGTKEWGDVLSDIASQLGSMFLNMAFKGLGTAIGVPGFAEGGYVDKPTQAMIGEAGEPEYAIPQSKMNSAMERYSQGMRGEAVTAGASEHGSTEEGEFGSGSGNAPINVNYSGPICKWTTTSTSRHQSCRASLTSPPRLVRREPWAAYGLQSGSAASWACHDNTRSLCRAGRTLSLPAPVFPQS